MPRLSVRGLEIEYLTQGDATRPPLLLLMGTGAPLVFWDDQFCDELCRRGFHVIRFDARDTGRSSRIDSPVPSQVTELLALLQAGQIAPPYGLEDLADDAIALLDALVPGRPAHLLGISQGGAVAQLMVLRAPNRVASLSLIASYTSDPASPPPDPNTMAALLTPIATDREGMVARELLIYRLTGSRSRPASEAWLRQRAERLWAYGFHPQGFIRHLLGRRHGREPAAGAREAPGADRRDPWQRGSHRPSPGRTGPRRRDPWREARHRRGDGPRSSAGVLAPGDLRRDGPALARPGYR